MATKHYIIGQRIEQKWDRTDWVTNEKRKGPPKWLLDMMADRKIDGGFKTKKANLCGECFQYRSVNGACGC